MNVESLKKRLISHPGTTPALNLSVIAVEGENAQDFLQGQLTVDLSKLTGEQHQIAAWCNVKGRVWAVLRTWRSPKGFNLLLPTDQAEAFVKRLRMFVLRAKVTIETQELAVHGVIAAKPYSAEQNLRQTADSVELLLSASEAIHIAPTPATGAPISADQWTALRILSGEPQITAATQEKFLPQSLNLNALGGLHFNKGCYVGQEIVARVHYKGRAPQRLACGLDPSDEELSGKHIISTAETELGRVVQWVENIRD